MLCEANPTVVRAAPLAVARVVSLGFQAIDNAPQLRPRDARLASCFAAVVQQPAATRTGRT